MTDAMEGHGDPCCKCGVRCDLLVADPGKWPLILVPVWNAKCEAGKPDVHCSSCVHKMMNLLALVRAVWPIDCEDYPFVPTCRYCGTQRGTPDGEHFVHETSCPWEKLRAVVEGGNG